MNRLTKECKPTETELLHIKTQHVANLPAHPSFQALLSRFRNLEATLKITFTLGNQHFELQQKVYCMLYSSFVFSKALDCYRHGGQRNELFRFILALLPKARYLSEAVMTALPVEPTQSEIQALENRTRQATPVRPHDVGGTFDEKQNLSSVLSKKTVTTPPPTQENPVQTVQVKMEIDQHTDVANGTSIPQIDSASLQSGYPNNLQFPIPIPESGIARSTLLDFEATRMRDIPNNPDPFVSRQPHPDLHLIDPFHTKVDELNFAHDPVLLFFSRTNKICFEGISLFSNILMLMKGSGVPMQFESVLTEIVYSVRTFAVVCSQFCDESVGNFSDQRTAPMC